MNAFTVLFSDGPDIRIRDAPIDHIHHPEQPTLPPGCRDFWGNVVGAFDAQCNVGLHGFLWRERDQRHILLLIKKNCFFKCVDKDLKKQMHRNYSVTVMKRFPDVFFEPFGHHDQAIDFTFEIITRIFQSPFSRIPLFQIAALLDELFDAVGRDRSI